MGTVFLVQVDPATRELLRASGAHAGSMLEVSAEESPVAVDRADGTLDAIVLGPHVPDSPRLAGRLHMRDPEVELLLLLESAAPDGFRDRLVREGLPGDRVHGRSVLEPAELADDLRRGIEATRRRRAAARRSLSAQQRAEIAAERARLEALFENAPIPAAWLYGPDHTAEYGNSPVRELYGGHWRLLAGLPARDAVPEVAEQGYFALLDYVYESGDPFVGTELPVRLDRNGTGELEEGYYTFIFQPTRNAGGEVNGILLLGVEVTDEAVARERIQELADAAATERDRLRQVLETLPEGILLADSSWAVTGSNRAAQDILGEVLDDLREFDRYGIRGPDGTPTEPEELPLARAIREGHVVKGEQLVLHNLETGQEMPVLVNTAPVRNKSGQITGAVAAFQDISRMKSIEEEMRTALEARDQSLSERDRALQEAEAAQRRVHFLLEASTLLGAVLDFPRTLHRLARLAVPFLGDMCLIDMQEPDGSIRRMAAAAADPAAQPLASLLMERHAPDPRSDHPIVRVIATGSSVHASEIPDAFLGPAGGEHRRILREVGATSFLCVPLSARGRILGAITLMSTSPSRRYSVPDVELAEDLARRAALAVDNARLYGEHVHIARTLQASLLPRELPEIPGVEIAARYHAAGEGNEVGGDFYDMFETGDQTWGIVIGDVCGKGAEAAAVTGQARYTVRAAAMRQRRPSLILQTLNEALRQQRTDGRFCTVAYARLLRTAAGARVTVCSGGHPPPLLLRADGTVEPVGRSGTLLGVFADPELADHVADLFSGDALMLYTDGVIGARGRGAGNVLSEEQVADLLSSCAGRNAGFVAEQVEQLVLDFQQGDLRDDVALLVIRVTG